MRVRVMSEQDSLGPVIHVFASCFWRGYVVREAVYGSSCPHRPYALLVVFSLTSSIMRSGLAQRAPSPTNTAFSGISSYRTDPYKPFRDKSSISSPPVDSYQVARTHYDELSKYLASYLAKGALSPLSISLHFTSLLITILASEPANSRSTARQKLTRLTRQQFQELSTDVYDELIRRKANADSNQGPSFFSLPLPPSDPSDFRPLPPRP